MPRQTLAQVEHFRDSRVHIRSFQRVQSNLSKAPEANA